MGEYFKSRKFITGFLGPAGTAIITKTEGRILVDRRYFIQAAKQLEGTTVELMKMGKSGVLTIEEYLKETLISGETLGFYGCVVSVGEGQEYEKIAKANLTKVEYNEDLISKIWNDRPELSKEPAFALDIKY